MHNGNGLSRVVENVRDRWTNRARARLLPIQSRLAETSATLQSASSRRLHRLARQIRDVGYRWQHPRQADRLARALEETADYLRFRPSPEIARDAAALARAHKRGLLAAGMLGSLALLALAQRTRR